MAGFAGPVAVATLEMLHKKYTPSDMRLKGVNARIASAILASSNVTLSLVDVLYATRNWSVHGSAIAANFRGDAKFRDFVGCINNALAEIHVGIAGVLLANL